MIAALRQQIGNELEALSDELAQWMALALDDLDVPTPAPVDEERVRWIQQRMGMLGRLVMGLASVDPTTISMRRAGFGSVVRVSDVRSGEEHTYTLMTSDLVDLNEGHVSLASPMGHALQDRARGEEIVVTTPRGERRYKILSVCTLPQRIAGRQPARVPPERDVVLRTTRTPRARSNPTTVESGGIETPPAA